MKARLTQELINVISIIPQYQAEVRRTAQTYMSNQTPENLTTYIKTLASLAAKQELMEFLCDILEPTDG